MKKKSLLKHKLPLLLLVLSVFTGVICQEPVLADQKDVTASRQTITEDREKIAALQEQAKKLKKTVGDLKALKSDAASYIEKLDQQLEQLEQEKQELIQNISETEQQIAETQEALSEAIRKEETQFSSMKERIRCIYETGSGNFFEELISSGSLSGLLNNAEYVKSLAAYDRKKLDEFAGIRASVEEKKEQLETESRLLEEQKTLLEESENSLKTLLEQKQNEVKSYEKKIAEAGEQTADIQQNVEKLNRAIKAEEAKIAAIEAEQRRKEGTDTAAAVSSTGFRWPCPASSRITSSFGAREAPVKGASTSHKGIDIGAPSGSDVLASQAGTVVIATYSASAGNYVMISHGGGIYTVYMHMKSLKVCEGDEVKQGSVIGYVGSTGYSTGPHLHFGVRKGGDYINPLSMVNP